MGGLLDYLGSDEARPFLGLLSGAAAKPGPRNTAGTLLGVLNEEEQRRLAMKDREQKAAMQALQMQLLGAQIGETSAQGEQRKAAAADAARKLADAQAQQQRQAAFLANPRMMLGGPPTVENAQRRPQINLAEAIAAYGPEMGPKVAQALATSSDLGRPEVARVEETMDSQGRPVKRQLTKFGDTIGTDLGQWKAPVMSDTGGAINALDPVTLATLKQFQKTNTPDALLGAQTTMRGQNMTDARSREKNANDAAAIGKVDWKQDVNGAWIGLPKEPTGPGPVTPVMTTAPGKREQQAQNALDIIKLAEPLIPKGTSSVIGAGVDIAGRAFGASPKGADEAAQLKTLEGALMMAQPRMEGPQSNLDVKLYRQMAAAIGDPTVPVSQKQAAIGTLKQLQEKYAGGAQGATPPVRRYNPATGRIE